MKYVRTVIELTCIGGLLCLAAATFPLWMAWSAWKMRAQQREAVAGLRVLRAGGNK